VIDKIETVMSGSMSSGSVMDRVVMVIIKAERAVVEVRSFMVVLLFFALLRVG
jgi:hypothetical protein